MPLPPSPTGQLTDVFAPTLLFHSALTLAAVYNVPVILATVNNHWAISSFSGIAGAERATFAQRAVGYGVAGLRVDGNDALDVYHSARWARVTALGGQPVFLDCLTFRMGLYSSHFGEVRAGIENDFREWEKRDPIVRLEKWLIENNLTTADELARLQREEEQRIEATFLEVAREI